MANSNNADAMIGAAFGVGIGTKLTSWKRDVIAGLKTKIISLLGRTQEIEAKVESDDSSPDPLANIPITDTLTTSVALKSCS